MPELELLYKIDKKTNLQSFLKEKKFSDSLIAKLKNEKKNIFIGNELITFQKKLTPGDVIKIILPHEKSNINIVDGILNIIYEDDFIMVLNKPHNIAVIGTIAHHDYHLSGIIIKYYNEKNTKATVHYVNRLDKDTSGLIIVAKHQYIHGLFAHVQIKKKYLLKVNGNLIKKEDIIISSIKKDATYRSTKYMIDENGKKAMTKYKVVNDDGKYSNIEAELLTGRTHQLRVQFSSMGFPIVGDTIYNGEKAEFLHLESYYLSFVHPVTKVPLTFILPIEW
ncbi:MAG: RluA family pseudouridine synthase [Bacilli bacterium]|nr:RluA family pseudouridine synthase [Bacilli bacterium]